MPRPLTVVGVGAGVTVAIVALAATFLSGSKTLMVTTSSGLPLEEVLEAFSQENIRNSKGIKNIEYFTKSGGSSFLGERQPDLRVDLPVNITKVKKEVSFQYFVDARNDFTPTTVSHCSDVRLHVYLDEKSVHMTPWMGYADRGPAIPLQTEKITLHDVPVGLHDIGLVPEGRLGGCDTQGFVLSWGGTAVIYQ